jgi:hypothetical protein
MADADGYCIITQAQLLEALGLVLMPGFSEQACSEMWEYLYSEGCQWESHSGSEFGIE